ncbi:MAG: DUF4012 domain-containing protein [Patescibacteria group bacterium]
MDELTKIEVNPLPTSDLVVEPSPKSSDISVSEPDPKKKNHGKIWKTLGKIFLVFLIIGGILAVVGWRTYGEILGVLAAARDVQQPAQAAYEALKSQDLIKTGEHIQVVEQKVTDLQQRYSRLSWLKPVPFAGAYYRDGEHAINASVAGMNAAKIAVQAVEPYADVLGFSGKGSFTGGSIDNRLKLILGTLSKVTPVVDELGAKLEIVGKELAQIDEKRYPESFRGTAIRQKIVTAKEVSAGASQALEQAKPVLQVLPSIAGADGKRRRYFILFENNNELRPTGGFMTAFATLLVEDGRVTAERSEDIYQLDIKFKNKPEIPPILKKYLTTEKRWNLRDMNLSPDFKNSMDVFWSYYSKLPGESAKDIDGIIAIDTSVLEKLVEILGPVEVPGYGTFSAENDKQCDCPQIIYALSEIVDRPTPFLRTNRKGIIGPMMRSVLEKAYSAPHQLWPQLFGESWASIQAKHVQFYFFNEEAQKAAESIGVAGRVKETPPGLDYMFIVDSNLGGAKSNLFVQQTVTQEVDLPANGMVKKTITLTYKNPFPPSNCDLEAGELCLNGKLTDWLRIYLPQGAQVSESLGFDTGSTKTTEELGHTVYEGVFTLQPLNQAKIVITYTVPYTDIKNYKMFVQKQAGIPNITYLMRVNGGEQEVLIDKDQTVTIPF